MDFGAQLEANVLAGGFGEGPKEADWVRSVWRTIGFDNDSPWHLVGLVDSRAVATASLLMTGAIGGIYFVATRPDQRRHGFGELTDGEITDGVLALARLADQVDAALAGFTSVLDTRCLHTTDGARSPAAARPAPRRDREPPAVR